ncbi:hypothetical protein ACH427_18290 [Streptomyces sp. NPDC020379]|uniref:hypothetical protein n=1 Tax=Streptomyces sp. NPDC020379 TaxID=3365071 RepID=UPI0037BC588F
MEEETALSRGAVHIRRTHPRPDAFVIGEPSGWSTVVLGYKGKLDLRYEVACEATHPSNPLPKATELVAGAWATLLELLGPDAGHGSFDQPGPTLQCHVPLPVPSRAAPGPATSRPRNTPCASAN